VVHALLRSALESASAYRVLKPIGRQHFNVWRFRRWDHPQPGWKLVDQTKTRADAEAAILERLGLEPSVEREPVHVVMAVIPSDCDPA
jgi:hypothetical protein